MNRPFLSIQEQKELLRNRGLLFEPTEELEIEAFLLNVNYFRGSQYWRMFYRDPNDPDSGFRDSVTFTLIRELYEWDTTLRRLLLDGLAIYEIAFRARFTHFFSSNSSSTSYLELSAHEEVFVLSAGRAIDLRQALLSSLQKDLKNSHDPLHVVKIEEDRIPPLWVAIEALSMGTVSKMYKVAKDDTRYQLSKNLRLPNPEIAEALFHSLTVFRNHLAHHGRVWHFIPKYLPQVLRALKVDADKSIYEFTPWALIISMLHQLEIIDPAGQWTSRIMSHIDSDARFKNGLTHPRY